MKQITIYIIFKYLKQLDLLVLVFIMVRVYEWSRDGSN